MAESPADERRPTAIDLYAGCGGSSLGLEQAGFDLLAAVEYDPVHATTHAYNFPRTEVVCDDISAMEMETLRAVIEKGWSAHRPNEDWDGELDLVAGGPPCQGFSPMGKRRLDDSRNDLIFHFFRIVRELRPRYFLMENVPGMLSGNQRALLDRLIWQFEEEIDYSVQPPQVLNAANYGVPQDRRRLILLGNRKDCTPAEHPAPTVRPVRAVRSTLGPASDDLPLGPPVWDAIGDLPDLDSYSALLASDSVHLTAAIRNRMKSAASQYARRLAGFEDDPLDLSYPREWDPSLLTSSTRTEHTKLSMERFVATGQGATEPVSRFFKLAEGGLCNTIRAGTGSDRGAYTSPRPIHPRRPRVISVREAARLHSFPDWFRLHATKWHGFRQVGNAVPPLLGRAIGRSIISALGIEPAKPSTTLAASSDRLLTMSMNEAAAYMEADRGRIPPPRRRIRDQLGTTKMSSPERQTRYEQVIEHIFDQKYQPGMEEVPFEREDLIRACEAIGIAVPKNLGDVLYSFRYRRDLPAAIADRAPGGKMWIIVGRGRAKYAFVAVPDQPLTPNPHLSVVKVPDSTPGIIAKHVLSSEQALLAKVRYNRLIDIFTGIVCYSLQNHLRTTVGDGIQVETDEIYLGIDRTGAQYVIPVEAKGGADRLSIVQLNQDLALCKEKFPDLECRPVGAQFVSGGNDVSLFLFAEESSSGNVKVIAEKRYRLVPPEQIGADELAAYRKSLPSQ